MSEAVEQFDEDVKELMNRFRQVINDYYPDGITHINLGSITASGCKLMLDTMCIVFKKYPQFDIALCLNDLSNHFSECANRLKKV
jgi:hypothetical protein